MKQVKKDKLIPILFILAPILFLTIINYGSLKNIGSLVIKKQLPQIKIDKVEPGQITAGIVFNEWQGQSSLGLKGQNFTKESKIYINDMPLDTTFGDSGFISAIVPKELFAHTGQLAVQVKIVDGSNQVLAASDIKVIPVKPNPESAIENNKLKITSTEPLEVKVGQVFNEYNGQAAIGIKGESFTSKSVIYINDKPLITTYGSPTFITALVPKEFYEIAGVMKVQVKINDGNNKVIQSSNVVEIKVNN